MRNESILALTLAASLAGTAMAQTTPLSAAAKEAAGGNNSFAADLYGQLVKKSADQNLFISPYSISAALGMTAQGAKGNTAAQMDKVLHIGGNFQAGMSELYKALNPAKAPYELSVANDLWVEQTYPLVPAFVADAKKNYGAGVIALDFVNNAEASRKIINDAIATETRDKIKDLIPQGSVDKSTGLVLTDAIYFKGTWETQFNKQATTDQPFHAAGGKDETVPMMRSPNSTSYAYGETDDAQVISLPYLGLPNPAAAGGRGRATLPGELSMLIILPKKVDGLADVEKEATAENLAKWSGELRRQPVQVYLPRFTLTSQFELSDTLQAMGMTDAFSRQNADFTGIANSAAGKLYLSKVIHKAYVDVNEEGTEAAAATAVIGMRATAIVANRAEFRADHPFLFVIRHEPTGSILFLGQVNDPK